MIDKTARISVVLASYNGEKYINEQISSLLKFLSFDDEIIVSDDASSDLTRSVVAANTDVRVKLLPPGPRLGYQKNFERAISFSKGNYILFSDQDDICLVARLEDSINGLRTHSVVAGDAQVVDEELNILAPSYFAQRNIRDFSALSLFLKPKVIGATIAVTREFLEYARPFPRHIPHDQWLSTLAAIHGELLISQKPFIRYRRHSNVVTHWGNTNKRPYKLIVYDRCYLLLCLIKKIIFSGFWTFSNEK